MKIKNKEKGFTTVDLSIAMMVMVVFVSIMSSLIYSVYMSSTEARRTATALNYGVDIFEEIGQHNFQSLTPATVLTEISNVKVDDIKSKVEGSKEIVTGKIGTYNLKLEMTKPFLDGTIKHFKLTITYNISAKKTETIELERIRTNKT